MDGVRRTRDGDVQRYLCRSCGYRFSPRPLQEKSCWVSNSSGALPFTRQICVTQPKGAKNLAEKEPQIEIAQREGTMQTGDVKGKIVEYSFWLLKQGYAKTTIEGRTRILKRLAKLGDLFNPESVKEVIAKQEWSAGRRENAVDAYSKFLQLQNMKWEPPQYRRIRKLPFIPAEVEIDALIGACSKRISTFLQLLKETGIRCGEACQLKWTDIDAENSSIRVTPEKGSNPRIFQVTSKLMSMINALPKGSSNLFHPNPNAMRRAYQRQRKRAALKLQNPRLMQISFHTFRHWKATMEYHKTKDILHVMRILGHKNINNTLIYTQLINFKDDDYVAKVAHSEQEVCQLIEAGYEYVCDYGANRIFRKRK